MPDVLFDPSYAHLNRMDHQLNQPQDDYNADHYDEPLQEQLNQMEDQPQQQQGDYFVQPHMSPELGLTDRRSLHQKQTGIASIRKTVETLMPGTYTHIDEIRMCEDEKMRQSPLHHSRGQKLDASDVLEFDMAGSGFKQFRKEKHGFHGKDSYRINDKDAKTVQIKEKPKSLITVSWYNKTRWLNWIPGIKTEAKILQENEKRNQFNVELQNKSTANWLVDTALEAHYGEQQKVGGKVREHVRKKVTVDPDEKTRTRITMAGPLKLGGKLNRGEYSIQNLRGYMLDMAKDYLTGIFKQWDSSAENQIIPIIIKGHSRGAVAAVEGAMMIKQWVHDEYPQYEERVKFELTQYDPVAGIGSNYGVNAELDHKSEKSHLKSGDKMRALGASAETTVVYSLHTEHSYFFTPQMIKGAKRMILTPFNHNAGTEQVDQSAVRQGEEEFASQQSHSASYTDAATGDVYRGSGISELGEGVYIVDESNTMINLKTCKQAEAVINTVLAKTKGQKSRHKILLRAVKAWFDSHGDPKV